MSQIYIHGSSGHSHFYVNKLSVIGFPTVVHQFFTVNSSIEENKSICSTTEKLFVLNTTFMGVWSVECLKKGINVAITLYTNIYYLTM